MSASDSRGAPRAVTDLDLAGVVGIAFLLMFLGSRLSGLDGEELEWRLFMVLGSAFPAVLVGLPYLERRWTGSPQWVLGLHTFFRAIGVTSALAFVVHGFDLQSLTMAAVCAGLAVRLGVHRDPTLPASASDEADPRDAKVRRILGDSFSFLTILAACHAIPRLIYPMYSLDDGWTYRYWWGPLRYGQILWLAVLVAAVGYLLNAPRNAADPLNEARQPGWLRRITAPLDRTESRRAWLVATLVLVAGAMRLPDFSYWIPYHHWGVFVGPVDLVRDGGTLLWDVPGQYGFLSMLTVAAVPFVDSWEAFRLVQAVALTGSAVFVFGCLFTMRKSRLGFAVALPLAFAAVYQVPGEIHHLRDVFTYPSFGAFRFWGTYAMMAIAVWEARTHRVESPAAAQRVAPLVVGAIVWVVAVLWSVESFVYATATWLPALAWSRYMFARRRAPVVPAIGTAARALAAPLGLLAVTCFGIWAFYRAVLGVTPDVRGYYEYALSFRDFLPLLIQPLGPGLYVFVAFLLTSNALARSFSRADRPDLQITTLAAWGATWAAMSYFVPRSPPANATALTPVLVAALLLTWRLSDGAGGPWRHPATRWVASTFLAMILFVSTYEPSRLPRLARALVTDPVSSMASVLPRVDPSLEALLMRAGVSSDDRIVFLYPNVMGTYALGRKPGDPKAKLMRSTPWLPLYPGAMAHPIPEERRAEYIDRFARRGIDHGWYVRLRWQPYLGKGYLFKLDTLMDERYPAVRTYQNAEYVLEWREPKEAPRGLAPPPRGELKKPRLPLAPIPETPPGSSGM